MASLRLMAPGKAYERLISVVIYYQSRSVIEKWQCGKLQAVDHKQHRTAPSIVQLRGDNFARCLFMHRKVGAALDLIELFEVHTSQFAI